MALSLVQGRASRRQFVQSLTGLALLAGCGRLAFQSAPPSYVPRLGVLLSTTPYSDPNIEAFREGLDSLGYVDGRNITIDYRYAEGRMDRLPGLAAELVAQQPDVILALSGPVAAAAKQATATIPIIVAISGDPVLAGLVTSLARPEGNITGVSFLTTALAGKRLEFLTEVAPEISHVGFIWDPAHPDYDLRETQQAADRLGIRVHSMAVRGPQEFDSVFQAATSAEVDGLIALSSSGMNVHLQRIVDFAATHRLPLVSAWGRWAEAGALLTYGPNINDVVFRAATYVAKILRGAKPADLPVELPTKFQLVINLQTARALGLSVPRELLLDATEVLQ
jgi:putative tryptophan/tyrosine transport system substrate-binding protein